MIHHGTNPATTTGAATKNRTEPRMLIAFDIATTPSASLGGSSQPGVMLPCGAAAGEVGLISACGKGCIESPCVVEGDVAADRLPRFFDAIIGTQIDFLVLDGSPGSAFDKNVVSPCALAVHADRDGVVDQHAGEFGRDRARCDSAAVRACQEPPKSRIFDLTRRPYGCRFIDREFSHRALNLSGGALISTSCSNRRQ